MVPNELHVASFLPGSGTLHGSPAHGGTAWMGRPIPRQRAHRSGVDGRLCPSEERQAVNHNLESTRNKVVDGVEIQISDQDVCAHPATFREETPFCPRPQRLHKLIGGGQGCQGDGHTGKNEQSGEGHPQTSQEQDSEGLRITPEYPVYRHAH